MVSLVEPAGRYRESFLEALREFQAEGRRLDLDAARLAADFGGFLRGLRDEADRAKQPPGRVPQTTFWLVDGDEFIGRSSLRHELNAALLEIGGHIGYEIRPTKRRRGYGQAILRLTLPQARVLGLRAVLVTCAADNAASRAIIERNGGRFEDRRAGPDGARPTLRYWIALP